MKVLMIVLICGLFVRAQTPPVKAKCDLTLEQSPTVRGLRLGMTDSQAMDVLRTPLKPKFLEPLVMEGSSIIRNDFGLNDFISVDVYENRISEISVIYSGVDWASDREFVENFSPKLGLPIDAWVMEKGMSPRMECPEFSVRLMRGGFESGYVSLVDKTAVQKLKDRTKRAEDAAKKAIKP